MLILWQILQLGGADLLADLRKIEGCKTGEAKITLGTAINASSLLLLLMIHCHIAYNLPSRHIIHTVGPKYNIKYKTAAENALHNCYRWIHSILSHIDADKKRRSCLQVLKENGLQSIAFPVINSEKRGYPPENGAHIAISIVTVNDYLQTKGIRDCEKIFREIWILVRYYHFLYG